MYVATAENREKQQQKHLERKRRKKKLGTNVEVMLVWAPDPTDIIQIRKLIIFPKEQDGDIWGDPNDRKLEGDDSLSPSNPPEYEARCIIETEETTEPWWRVGNHSWKPIPFNLIQFEKCCGHKPGWAEIQQVESYQCIHNNSPHRFWFWVGLLNY